jgi:hypothetical protein
MREPENLNDPHTPEPIPTNLPTAIQTDAAPRPTSSFRALRHRNYQLFWFGSFFSNIGTWMQAVAQGWLVRELTASPTLI